MRTPNLATHSINSLHISISHLCKRKLIVQRSLKVHRNANFYWCSPRLLLPKNETCFHPSHFYLQWFYNNHEKVVSIDNTNHEGMLRPFYDISIQLSLLLYSAEQLKSPIMIK